MPEGSASDMDIIPFGGCMFVCYKPASGYSAATEKVDRSGTFPYAAVVGSTLGNKQLIPFVQNMFFTVKNLNVFTIHADNILIEFVDVLF